jgi:hypothetical protein
MEVIHNLKKTGIDITKKIYECSICANLFNWGPGTWWFGSYSDMESKPENIIYCCSEGCKKEFENQLKLQE